MFHVKHVAFKLIIKLGLLGTVNILFTMAKVYNFNL